MIGDVPKNAPTLCKLGQHTGQGEGGTMVFQCSRCGGSYWQAKDYSAITRHADALIMEGRVEDARRVAREAVSKGRTQDDDSGGRSLAMGVTMGIALWTALLAGVLAVLTPNGGVFVVGGLFALFVALWASERPRR